MQFFTIGVYDSTEQEFFQKLIAHHIDTFCDIRRRRGVRGSLYAFVNSSALQIKLKKLGIRYIHVLELAPTNEIRELQKDADDQKGERQRARTTISKAFASAYKEEVLTQFDLEGFIQDLTDIHAERVVFFCVEANAEACHRGIVAEKLRRMKYEMVDL